MGVVAYSAGAGRPGVSPRGRRILIGIAIAVVVVILFLVFTRIYTNVLWYQSIGFSGIYSTLIATRIGLFVAGAVLIGGSVLLSLLIAKRLRPKTVPNTPDQQALARYRRAFEPHLTKFALVISGLVGLVGGLSADNEWRTVLGFLNRVSFGEQDPQFGMDVSFYVFSYPFIRLLLGYGFAMIVVAFLAAAATHYAFGGMRFAGRGGQLSSGARAHLGILAGVFMVLLAADYWMDRYGLVHSDRGVTAGASYTDVHAVLPAKTILAAIALLCAAMFVVSAVRRGLLFAGMGLGLLILSAVLVGGAYPAVVQQFQVKPNQEAREREYIDRNIKSTRDAYDVADTEVTPYNARRNVTQDQTSDSDSTENIRLVDPNVVSKTFQQLQQIRGFYSFSESLDIDRYAIDGNQETTVAAVRELPGAPEGQRGRWVVDRLQYTHGYGFVGADGTQVDDEGKPVWQSKDIPPKGSLGKYEPRVYFGEQVPSYSIVGAPKGAPPQEFDYSSEGGSGQTKTTYNGDGGVKIGSFWQRLLYAVEMRDYNILFSGDINEESQILYDRSPRDRVQKAAPFLELDGDPYPAVVDGRIQWIVDGYTTTDMYPYSQKTSLDEATEDSLTGTAARTAQPEQEVNYIRNSVKATVDAYSGEVTLYAWDAKDPVLKTWQKAFGNKVKPVSEMSDAVRDHVRYPADMFKAQREILSRYHVTNPAAFYGGQEYWQTPNDPTAGDAKIAQPPYYLETRMPGDDEARFSLTSTFVPRGRPNLAGFVSVSSEPGNDYGKLRVLKLPSNTAVPGPGTMQGNFEAYAPAAQELSLLRRGGSSVRFGNLLTLPFGGGLLYVEPVYVQARTGESYPLLQRVLVSFGGKIGYAPTLDEAIDQVLGGASNGDDTDEGKEEPRGDVQAQLEEALQDAQDAYEEGQAALKKGDFAAYGDAQKKLKTALDEAERLRQQLGNEPSPTPSGTATSPSPSTSPSGRPEATPSRAASPSRSP
ncbi:MAG: UPF0182 family protein [Streptosporangiales bacterium]|nr:UPF0182 family protein [Streptosporangiales bacterium]